jgi:hypothetical protein
VYHGLVIIHRSSQPQANATSRLRSDRLGSLSLLAALGFAGLAGAAAMLVAWPSALALGGLALTYGVAALARG